MKSYSRGWVHDAEQKSSTGTRWHESHWNGRVDSQHVDRWSGRADGKWHGDGKSEGAQVFIRTPAEVVFPLAESQASLGQGALGWEFKGFLIDKLSDSIPAFGPAEWRNFIDGVFGHFTLSKVSEEMWTLRKYDKPGEAEKVTMEPAEVIRWLQERWQAGQ